LITWLIELTEFSGAFDCRKLSSCATRRRERMEPMEAVLLPTRQRVYFSRSNAVMRSGPVPLPKQGRAAEIASGTKIGVVFLEYLTLTREAV
jgi:hypothetical protein